MSELFHKKIKGIFQYNRFICFLLCPVIQALNFPMPGTGSHKSRPDDRQVENKQRHSRVPPSHITRDMNLE